MEYFVTNTSTLAMADAIVSVLSALVLGLIISVVFKLTNKSNGKKDYQIAMIMLPSVVAMLIFLINNNVATAFSLAGAFGLIRFRSEQGSVIDVVYIFFSLVVGLACGLGYPLYGLVFTIIISLLMFVISAIRPNKEYTLQITIPENVDYEVAFNKIFENFTTKHYLVHVKSKDFGSLFELQYKLTMKENKQMKKFLDDLRVVNSNLNMKLIVTE